MKAACKAKVIAVIKTTATIDGQYYADGAYCVIGGLLRKAGFPLKKIKAMDDVSPCGIDTDGELFDEARQKLKDCYNISRCLALELQNINDDAAETEERRCNLIKKVERA